MIKEPKLTQVSDKDLESYAREAKENYPDVLRFIVKKRMHIGAAYLLFDAMKSAMEKENPEVKGLINERSTH